MSGIEGERPVWERVDEVQLNVAVDNVPLMTGGYLITGPDTVERDFLLEPEDLDISCRNCAGVCCLAGMRITLNNREYTTLAEAGTGLEPLSAYDDFDDSLPRQESRYLVTTSCAFLSEPTETGQRTCTIYDDPRRPRACGNFKVGGKDCRVVRAATGVDSFMRATYRRSDSPQPDS